MDKKLIFKNYFANNSKESQQNKNLVRIVKKSETLSLNKRLYPIHQFASAGLILFLIISALTEILFIYSLTFSTFHHHYLALGISIVGTTCLEIFKFHSGHFFFRFIVQGWLKDGILYIICFIIFGLFCISIFGLSFYLSVNGAPKIVSFYAEQTANIELIDVDSIQLKFDQKITPLLKDKKEAGNIKWKGTTTQHATKLSSKIQDQINAIELQRDSAISRANKENDSKNKKFDSIIKDNGNWLSGFGGISEVFTLLLLLFLEVYDKASYDELPNKFELSALINGRQKNYQNGSPTNSYQTKAIDSFPLNGNVEQIEKPIDKKKVVKPKKEVKVQSQQSSELNDNDRLIIGKIKFNDKYYDESRFKDWMKKIEDRSINNKYKKSRESNKEKLIAMQKVWTEYQNQIKDI